MATTDPLDGFILKKEASAKYNRSLRQLGRDFDKALVAQDTEFLSQFKLRTEDGTLFNAIEVSKDKIQELRDRGLNPTWFVSEQWMRDTYGVREEGSEKPPADEPAEAEPFPPRADSEDASHESVPSDDVLKLKDEVIDLLRSENEFLRDSLTMERERSTDDKELTRQLHVLLKNMQDRLLPVPTSAATQSITTVNRRSAKSDVIDVQDSVSENQNSKKAARKANLSDTTAPKTSSRKHPSSTKQSKTRPTNKSTAKRPKKRSSQKSKWYETPTLNRWFSGK